MRALLLLPLLAACDPIWAARVTLKDPADKPVEQATVALDCTKSERFKKLTRERSSDALGKAELVGTGTIWPTDCDVVITKAGYRPFAIVYRERCPSGPDTCKRVFEQVIVLQPEK